ncbi:hypothetical protein RPD_2178 [Rhodopseudomonas palustris BisB5]|uniref:Uncharacterized protein n=1 Tax=Rhodopseudomonas palustris (strain BisB5) TaxID=316057 RepID=Q138S6_RHOPS|nr:hypothetical protein RPD_2178 [Rhodopseudomonas palustris BisB5]
MVSRIPKSHFRLCALLALCILEAIVSRAMAQSLPPAPAPLSVLVSAQPATGKEAPAPTAAKLKDAASGLRTSKESGNDCAGGEDMRKLSASANSPAIVYNAKFVPAGETVDFGLSDTANAEGFYFAILTDDSKTPRDDSRHRAQVRKAGPNDDLVVKQLLSPGERIVSLYVRTDVAPWWWSKRNLYIYQCSDRRPVNVSYAPVYISPQGVSWAAAIVMVVCVYWLVSRAFAFVSKKKLSGWDAVNPIQITAGQDRRGSLSSFQIFFFTMIVFSMLLVVLLRTGILSDLSTTILELIGISGIGAAAAKGTDSSKGNLSPANLTWLHNKGWYDSPSVTTPREPTFYDLISSDDAFDVYRFQSLVFTVAVGVALLIGGLTQLASFTIPQNILGILGLSQIVYIAGKLVSPSDAARLDAAVTELREAEAKFRKSALTPGNPPPDLQSAIRQAPTEYGDYREKATGAAKLFEQIAGRSPEDGRLAPSLGIGP